MARRAALLLGVDRCGDLPRLEAAAEGARLMERWARSQGMDAVALTDEDGGEVIARDVTKAIQRLTEAGDVEQLLVYFAGHGVNRNYSEYWLLSDAPGDPNEAVNVRGSEARARYGPVPHVVFVSDACRTAAEGIEAQGVTGSEIFRNENLGEARWVDQFYAALLGRPALEIRDPDESSRRYRALYTECLREILSGDDPAALEEVPPGDDGVVRPWRLKERVKERVLERLVEAGLDLRVQQTPDAVITSDPRRAWIARLPLPLLGRSGAPRPTETTGRVFGADIVRTRALAELDRALSTGAERSGGAEEERGGGLEVYGEALPGGPFRAWPLDGAATRSSEDGPHFETACGLTVQGARIDRVAASRSRAQVLADDAVEIRPVGEPDELLLRFRDGRGVLLPVLPGFVARLAFEDGELVRVAFEPAEGTPRFEMSRQQRGNLAELRAVVAESSFQGVFRLERDRAEPLAASIRMAKGVDPAMAVYAAHAYHDLHRRDLVRDMATYLRNDLGVQLFDVALLAGERVDAASGAPNTGLAPFLPLLSQTWPLLGAYGARLPQGLERLHQHLLPSLWTLLDPRGTDLVWAEIERRKARR